MLPPFPHLFFLSALVRYLLWFTRRRELNKIGHFLLDKSEARQVRELQY